MGSLITYAPYKFINIIKRRKADGREGGGKWVEAIQHCRWET